MWLHNWIMVFCNFGILSAHKNKTKISSHDFHFLPLFLAVLVYISICVMKCPIWTWSLSITLSDLHPVSTRPLRSALLFSQTVHCLWGCFNIKMSYRYKISHCKYKDGLTTAYLYNGNTYYTWEGFFLSWDWGHLVKRSHDSLQWRHKSVVASQIIGTSTVCSKVC